MIFTHDTEVALQAAVALVNSAEPPDTLATTEDLAEWFTEYSFTGRRDADAEELDTVRALRPVLRELLSSDREGAAAIVNAMLSEARAVPQLVRHDAFDWHLHAVSPAAPLATRIKVEVAMAMMDVVRADEMSRLGVCDDEGCQGLVLDLSKNRSRRYCSVACGNRNAVAAYRARQAAETD